MLLGATAARAARWIQQHITVYLVGHEIRLCYASLYALRCKTASSAECHTWGISAEFRVGREFHASLSESFRTLAARLQPTRKHIDRYRDVAILGPAVERVADCGRSNSHAAYRPDLNRPYTITVHTIALQNQFQLSEFSVLEKAPRAFGARAWRSTSHVQ